MSGPPQALAVPELPDELLCCILEWLVADLMHVPLHLCLVSHQFCRCFAPIAYNTVILHSSTKLYSNFSRISGLPPSFAFNPSLVRKLVLHWSNPYIPPFFDLRVTLKNCPSIEAIHIYIGIVKPYWNNVVDAFGCALLNLHDLHPSTSVFFTSHCIPDQPIAFRNHKTNWARLTCLSVRAENGRFQRDNLLHFPNLLRVMFWTDQRYPTMRDATARLNRYKEFLPPSVRIFAVYFCGMQGRSIIDLFPANTLESILAMSRPAVVVGFDETVSRMCIEDQFWRTVAFRHTTQSFLAHRFCLRPGYPHIWDEVDEMISRRRLDAAAARITPT